MRNSSVQNVQRGAATTATQMSGRIKKESESNAESDVKNNSILNDTKNQSFRKLEAATIKAKLISGDYTFSIKRGRSKVWDIFAKIKTNTGNELKNTVACKTCYSIYKFDKSTSNLVKHKCYVIKSNSKRTTNMVKLEKSATNMVKRKYHKMGSAKKINESNGAEIDLETKNRAVQIVTEWTIQNVRCLGIINDAGLQKLAEFLLTVGASHGEHVNLAELLPQPEAIGGNICKLYEFHAAEVKNDILKHKTFGYGLTSDMWQDDYVKMSYITVTLHYIREGVLKHQLLAVKSIKGLNCAAERIEKKVKNILLDYGCDLALDKPIAVTAGGTTMHAVLSGLSRLCCANQLLHHVTEQAVQEVPELLQLVKRCSKIIKYFQKLDTNSNLKVTLESYCATRWNKVYYLLKAIEANWQDISSILEQHNEIHRLQQINSTHLSAVISLFAAFETSSKKLQDHSAPTLHLTIPYLNHLQKVCSINDNDINIVEKCKTVLTKLLQEAVPQNLTKIHKIALFLFPPTNKLSQFTKRETEQTIHDCREIMIDFLNSSPIEKVDAPPSPAKPQVDAIFADYMQPCQNNNTYDIINNEIQSYKNVNICFSQDFNVLQWWNHNKEQFPLLYKVSCKILAVPASSVASERAFATARNLLAEKRDDMATSEDLINKLLFLNANIPNINEAVLIE